MAPTSPSAHAEMQAWLQQRRTELRDEIAQASATVREIDVSDGSEVSDQKDESVRRSLSEVADAEQQRDIDELQQVEAALKRIADNRYGLCTDCGDAIAPARLRAQPAAPRCAACQTAAEADHQRLRV